MSKDNYGPGARSHRPSSWSQPNKRRSCVPPGLRGREIGMFFKQRQTTFKAYKKEIKKERSITLKIPCFVTNQVAENLLIIAKIAQDLNISVVNKKKDLFNQTKNEEKRISTSLPLDKDGVKVLETKTPDYTETADIQCKVNLQSLDRAMNTHYTTGNWFNEPNFTVQVAQYKPADYVKYYDDDIIEEKNKTWSIDTSVDNKNKSDDCFKKPDLIPSRSMRKKYDHLTSQPGSSSAPNFMLVGKEDPDKYGSSERIPSLRGGGDYKYGYEDIITGTFEEKLEDCLAKGISISTSTSDIKELNYQLHEELNLMKTKSRYNKMMKFRDKLPTWKKAQEILNIIENNQVVVISGETGCGKSTQVPQIILDNAICNKRGANVKIIVTQPRRIAASSLALRVAEERSEKLGNSVGYAVRLEKVEARPRGSIMYCTTGILLADLEVNQGLNDYSHVILDEVHERDSHIDLSMCVLKKVLQKRKDLKLILMSATLDAESLSSYFDNCPTLHIEGLIYPVRDVYLEDILQITKYELPKDKSINKWTKKRKLREKMGNTAQYRAEVGPWVESIKNNVDRNVYHTLLDDRVEELNIDLIFELLLHICKGPPGAILVFLPGIGEITKLIRMINESGEFPANLYYIFPLHSKLPSLEQRKIFDRPPNSIRKIIIATNIAETSITIDDIVFVIDCGKMRISGLDVEEKVATLSTEWITLANFRQRRGRAGRCQPGVCYHLLTSFRATKIPERMLPELQRSNLLEPVLTLKKLRLGQAADALRMMAAPPADSIVEWAVKHLQQCGALDDKETLTPLGWHLARLPVHPSAGKLLLLGALFGCLDRAASVAAVWGFKDPFQIVIGKEREVDETKRNFALGEPSDHVAISEAIIQWERTPAYGRHNFSYKNFLSNNTLELLSDMKKQLGDNLKQMGFLNNGDVKSAWENRNASNLSLFKALVAASLYPNIATVRWLERRGKQPRIKVYTIEDGSPVAIHPSSVMSSPPHHYGVPVNLCNKTGANWLVYWLKQKSKDLYLIEVTLVYTLPLLFFGELQVTVSEDDKCYMSISTVKVECDKETTEILFELRAYLDQVLASKVMASGKERVSNSEFEEQVLKTVIELLTAEDERAQYLSDASDQSESETESDSRRYWRQ